MGNHLAPNTRLNQFRVRDRLGSGGMGTVYRAEARAELPYAPRGSTVALKILHPHLTEHGEFVRRFHREGEIGRRIRHPNVVSVFDDDTAFISGSVLHFLVMEYVEGETLRQLLDDLGWIPEELCRHIGVEVAKALEAVHGAGAIHRDLKPENVLIDPGDRVKLMDLGVAKMVEPSMQLSTTGQFVGSMRYAAPEQFEGDGRRLDERVDLHGLGVLLYELCAGRHAFDGADAPSVMNQVMIEEPARLGVLRPQCSPVFERVVHRLLAKRPDARFANAGSVREVLVEGEASDWWAQHLAEGTSHHRSRIPAETRFCGRDSALASLVAIFTDSADGRGRVAWITGEAGIGKSRLLDEACRRAGTGFEILAGTYAPGSGGAFAAALRSKFGARGAEAAVRTLLPETPELVPPFAAWIQGDLGTPLDRGTLATLVVRTLVALADRGPLALVIEDLHEAPEIGHDLVAAVSHAVVDRRLALIVTSREAAAGNLVRSPQVTTVPLDRLSREEIRGLLTAEFGSETVADELVDPVAAGSGGNPFFLVEIVKTLREAPFLTRDEGGRFSLTGRVSEVRLPDTVTSLLGARIAGLTDKDREMLDLAACVGSSFQPDLLAAALSLSPIPVLRRLAAIERDHGLVRSAGRRFAFDHEQVRECLLGSMPTLLREEYHARLGEVLAERSDAEPGDVCRHLLAGRRFEDARPHLADALENLASRHRHEAVVALGDLALAEEGFLTGKARWTALRRAADSHSVIGRREEEQAALREAIDAAESARDDGARAQLLHHLGRSLIEVSRHDEGEEHLRAALELAVETGNRKVEGGASGSLGHIALHRGETDAARERFERHRECAEASGDRQGEGAALGNLGLLAIDLGRFEESADLQARSGEIARGIDDTHGLACALTNGGLALHQLGRLADARDAFAESIDLWRKMGNRQGEGVAIGNLGMVTNEMGLMGEALGHYERQLFLARETGYREGEGIARYNLGSLLLGFGDFEASHAHFESGELIGTEIDSTLLAALCRAGLGDALWLRGDLEAAEAAGRHALARIRKLDTLPYHLKVLLGLGRFLAENGDPAEATGILDEALALARELPSPESEVLAAALRATLPGVDPAEAVALYDRADPPLGTASAMEAAWNLHRATGEARFLADAARLLDEVAASAPEAHRSALHKNVPLHREIQRARKSLDSSTR